MSTVRIPPVLRPAVGGAKQVEAGGPTLAAVLSDLFARYPAVRAQILTPEGSLSRFVNVFVNDQDVRFLEGLNTPVGGNDIVVLLPAMAGGAVADRVMPPLPSVMSRGIEFRELALPPTSPSLPRHDKGIPLSPQGERLGVRNPGVGGEVY
jgi:molybdopterin synthase sulfur carrier subunit